MVDLSSQSGQLKIKISTLGISLVDVYIDSKPVLSKDVNDGTNKLIIKPPAGETKLVKVLGFEDSKLIAAKKIFLKRLRL